jgi:phosphatidylglycerophosphate synthase
MAHVNAGAAANAAHQRDHRSLTAAVEKRALIWMAERLPSWINSDHLSALGLGAIVAAGASFAVMAHTPWAAAGVIASLIINWFGDSLDGTVARVRGHQRPRYGYYVDHLIDIAGTAALLTGIAASGLMHPSLAFGLLAVYLLVAAETYLATHAAGVFRMSFLGFGPTELRLVLMAGAIKAAITPIVTVAGLMTVRLFDIGGIVAIAGLAIAFIVSGLRNTRALYAAEPLPIVGETRAA